MATPQKKSSLVHFTSETARAANAKSLATKRARAALAAQLAAQAAAQPQLLADNLTLAYSETLVMLRNAKSPQARFQLAKAVEALKRAMESQGRRGITVVNPPTPSSTKSVLPPPRPVMPAGHRAAELVTTAGNGLQPAPAPAPQPPEPIESEQPRPEADDEGQGHPATW